ncbi:cytochrome P450 [Lindgomyces ingoldianus]|uniref:Cytochrome P450 n=1 Tax=Lindgomyces ingoldianus TaxID=673940 RepID=A0ACB6R7M9_9PLEO|nr:cytochrome P450 [Lindgomyces ingoldianus]KAF2475254.1 cytochrome P450 [Lindgomyces ingoldianus]
MLKGFFLGLAAFGAVVLAILLYGVYNTFIHPLRSYPGPPLWKAFRLPYVISIHRGDMHRRLKEFHDKYGLIVRIAPNELSYADGRAWKDIYANRPGHLPFKRNPTWFQKLKADDPKSIMGPDEDAHSRIRRAFANSFSEKSLKDQSPIIERHVEGFMNQLKSPTSGRLWKEKGIDLVKWLNFLTFDISGDLSFGESFESVKNGKEHPWVAIAQDFGKGLSLITTANLYPPLNKMLRYILPKKIIQRQIDHRAMSAAKARKRLAMDTDRPDLVTLVKKYNDKKMALSDKEWEINMTMMIFAGSETTASALSAIFRELAQSRGVIYSLTQEIREAFQEESQITIASTRDLPYMNAVINEGLRLDPAVVVGVPRVVPKGGDTICGKWVSEGTYVAFNQFSANRLERNFHYPNSFIPERFLTKSLGRDDLSTFQPFGIGRHSCIGMKLAYAEMRLIIARLLYSFDLTLADEKDRWDWGGQATYMFWVKRPLQVILRRSGRT